MDKKTNRFERVVISGVHRRALVQSVRKLLGHVCQTLRRQENVLTGKARDDAERVLGLEPKIGTWIRTVLDQKLFAHRIRVHGDYHLGRPRWVGIPLAGMRQILIDIGLLE